MSEGEFRRRWLTLSYDRTLEQGRFAEFPKDAHMTRKRLAYGSNGIGRHAMFCFGDGYTVVTRKGGWQSTFSVKRGTKAPLAIELDAKEKDKERGHGTVLESVHPRNIGMTASRARTEVGMRFLT
jgi:hypothetical protein